MSKVGSSDSKNTLYCSFCGKSQQEVRKLIAGPTVFICNECIELCKDIIHEENNSSLVKSRDGIPIPKAHSTAKCNGEIFGVEEHLTRSLVAEYLSGARVEFILDPLDIGI